MEDVYSAALIGAAGAIVGGFIGGLVGGKMAISAALKSVERAEALRRSNDAARARLFLIAETTRVLRICETLPGGNPLEKTRNFVSQLGGFSFSHESLSYLTGENEIQTFVDLQGLVANTARSAEEVLRRGRPEEPWNVNFDDFNRLIGDTLQGARKALAALGIAEGPGT